MKALHDISVTINAALPSWPGSIGLRQRFTSDKGKGDFATNSVVEWDVHFGTHIDAPLHHIPGGKTTEDISLSKLIGPCAVISLEGRSVITAKDLELKNKHNPELIQERILFKTDNSGFFQQSDHRFQKDYCALDASAAQWLVDKDITLVGIDYYSIQKFEDGPLVHEVLLNKEIVILETINLTGIEEGTYRLICTPVRIAGIEGAPCRALLESLD